MKGHGRLHITIQQLKSTIGKKILNILKTLTETGEYVAAVALIVADQKDIFHCEIMLLF